MLALASLRVMNDPQSAERLGGSQSNDRRPVSDPGGFGRPDHQQEPAPTADRPDRIGLLVGGSSCSRSGRLGRPRPARSPAGAGSYNRADRSVADRPIAGRSRLRQGTGPVRTVRCDRVGPAARSKDFSPASVDHPCVTGSRRSCTTSSMSAGWVVQERARHRIRESTGAHGVAHLKNEPSSPNWARNSYARFSAPAQSLDLAFLMISSISRYLASDISPAS